MSFTYSENVEKLFKQQLQSQPVKLQQCVMLVQFTYNQQVFTFHLFYFYNKLQCVTSAIIANSHNPVTEKYTHYLKKKEFPYLFFVRFSHHPPLTELPVCLRTQFHSP